MRVKPNYMLEIKSNSLEQLIYVIYVITTILFDKYAYIISLLFVGPTETVVCAPGFSESFVMISLHTALMKSFIWPSHHFQW